MDLGSMLDALSRQIPEGAGSIGLLSGDEYLPAVSAFDEALIAATGARIGIVICADHAAGPHSADIARAHFASLGAELISTDIVHGDPAPEADLIYLGGGSPAELLDCLRGTPAWRAILDRWRAGTSLSGASAGAMGLCAHSLAPNPGDRVPTTWTEGLGPLQTIGLAVHASSRPRAWIDAIARDAPAPVLALDDRTGVILAHDAPPLIVGEGSLWMA